MSAPAVVTDKQIAKMSPKAQSVIKEARTSKAKAPTKPTNPKVTKKAVIINMVSSKNGSTVDEMAKAIVDQKIDLDFEKNKRTVRLWLSKIGFKVKKSEEGRYVKD